MSKTNQQLIESFTRNPSAERRNGNLSIRDCVLYSYEMPIAVFDSNMLLVSSEPPSRTTYRHCAMVFANSPILDATFYVPSIHPVDHVQNLAYLRAKVAELLATIKATRPHMVRRISTLGRVEQYYALWRKYRYYAHLAGLPIPADHAAKPDLQAAAPIVWAQLCMHHPSLLTRDPDSYRQYI